MKTKVKKEPIILGGCEILNYKNGDWFINVGTCRNNNGLQNQSFKLCINANIETVKRLTDNKCFTSNMSALKTKSGNIWATHFWFNNSLNTISVAGYYTKQNNPYNDETIKSCFFSPNICSITDLI